MSSRLLISMGLGIVITEALAFAGFKWLHHIFTVGVRFGPLLLGGLALIGAASGLAWWFVIGRPADARKGS